MISFNREVGQCVKSSSSNLAVTYRNIEELQVDPKNPRRHSKRQIQQIATSIEGFGFNVPFLVDRDSRLIAGQPLFIFRAIHALYSTEWIVFNQLPNSMSHLGK
jgi:hypothetical protein